MWIVYKKPLRIVLSSFTSLVVFIISHFQTLRVTRARHTTKVSHLWNLRRFESFKSSFFAENSYAYNVSMNAFKVDEESRKAEVSINSNTIYLLSIECGLLDYFQKLAADKVLPRSYPLPLIPTITCFFFYRIQKQCVECLVGKIRLITLKNIKFWRVWRQFHDWILNYIKTISFFVFRPNSK